MRRVLFAHGKPSRERYENPEIPKPHEANWFPWIVRQLGSRSIKAEVPALPRPYYPVFSDWKSAFPYHTIDRGTGLVGFSAGAEFLLRLLSEDTSLEAAQLVLVAPWRDTSGKYGEFSHYTLDAKITERVGKLTIISSLDDSEAIHDNAHRLAKIFQNAHLLELKGYGHFLMGNNMTSEEFPELEAVLLDEQ